MTLKRVGTSVRDFLSVLAVCFAFVDGIDRAFPSQWVHLAPHRWIGYLMVISSLALAFRLRSARRESIRPTQRFSEE